MRLALQYVEGCPHKLVAHARLLQAVRAVGLSDQRVELERVTTQEEAEMLRFLGSPTVLIDGHDPFAIAGHPYGLACRVYETPEGLAGSPTKRQLVDALQHAVTHPTP